ncbi:MAG: Rpn family recombination-promoting nuclease/putative transposase [Sodaliphilus sp.]
MSDMEDKYISLLTDFGFKRIFGTDLNKDLLIGFLNALFEGEHVITDVKYLNSEHLGDVLAERKAIFDVYCETENGEKFIVEMQNAFQEFFKDRSLFYSTFPIREQASKGSNWDFRLNHVYTIALINFDMREPAFDQSRLSHTVKLCDTYTHKVFYDKLDFIYVEIAKFDKNADELTTTFEKWLYVLKNLSRLDNQPQSLRDKVFDRLFTQAEIATFTPRELKAYEDSRKAYRDLKNCLDSAIREGIKEGMEEGLKKGMEEGLKKGLEKGLKKGLEQGRAEGAIVIAKKMKAMGMDDATIMQATGMSASDLAEL